MSVICGVVGTSDYNFFNILNYFVTVSIFFKYSVLSNIVFANFFFVSEQIITFPKDY